MSSTKLSLLGDRGGFTLILATLNGLDVGLLLDVIGKDECDDDDCDDDGCDDDDKRLTNTFAYEIENTHNLTTSLESFTKAENLENKEIKFTCDKCNQNVSVEKQLMLDLSPPVYAFYLKRFKNDGAIVEKIDKHVEFPLELDLLPYTCGNQVSNVGCPPWEVRLGRIGSTGSITSQAMVDLPRGNNNPFELIASFDRKGLNLRDMDASVSLKPPV
ncbi:ubiquitin carboxyl-terminal hydrolase 20-like protein [Tanacetum coccineum]